MLQEIKVGDIVRFEGDRETWRVDGRSRDGMLTLESMHAYPRMTREGVYEFRVQKVGLSRE